ncbi:MAG: DUF309 domain-containing protein [Haloferacaceae archaeon]
MEEPIEGSLRAGLALYAAGEYHAAHEPWEDVWLELEDGTDDERLFHGLIQYTAAVHHARDRNWEGAVGLAGSGREYLAGLPGTYRGVDVDAAVSYLAALERDPERIERGDPEPLGYDGGTLEATDLDLSELATAAVALGDEYGTYEADVLGDAIEIAREEARAGSAGVTTLLFDFVAGEGPSREFVYDRLAAQVSRRRRQRDDIDDLFE